MMQINTTHDLLGMLPDDSPLRDWHPIPGEGDPNPEVVLVKKAPSYPDKKYNRPLLGKDGLAVRNAMLRLGLRFYATYAVPFFHHKKKPTKKMGLSCQPALQRELDQLKPKRIIYFGPDAARWAPEQYTVPFRVFKDVKDRLIHGNGVDIRVVQNPAAFLNEPSAYLQFIEQVEEMFAPSENAPDIDEKGCVYLPIQNRAQARSVIGRFKQRIAFDLETTGLNPLSDRILTINFSDVEGTGVAFPWDLFSPSEWGTILAGRELVATNGKFDMKFLAREGVFVQVAEDAMLTHSVIDETPRTHSLADMSRRYLRVEKWEETVDYDDLENTDFRTLGRYGARDTDLTLRLCNLFSPQVKDIKIRQVLHDAQNAFAQVEHRGIKIDMDAANELSESLGQLLHDRKEYISDQYGIENPNSVPQFATALKERGIPTGAGTSAPALRNYVDDHPIIYDVLEYRNIVKAKSTYVDGLLAYAQHDGRYHPDYELAATETGRLAERLITLIPRSEGAADANAGKRAQQQLRQLFVPDEGYVMVGADFAALEVRMAAHLSKDWQLIHAINNDIDLHSVNAVSAFNLPIDLEPYATLKKRVSENNSHERSLAKIATFTWLFGGTEYAIMTQLGVDSKTSSAIVKTLTDRYRGLVEWWNITRMSARQNNVVYNLWGRPRHFAYDKGLPEQTERAMDREATNFPIQSISTDMNTRAFTLLTMKGLQTLFCVHDSVYLQCREDEVERVMKEVKSTMEGIIPDAPVTFEADVKWGHHWGEL